MNKITTALLICFLGHSATQAAEPDPYRSVRLEEHEFTPLRRAITVEAARLAQLPLELRVQSSQASKPADMRHWCLRHGTGCGALIGFTVGFLTGLMKPAGDMDPLGLGLIITGPIGAGIGAAVGWCIAEGTKPLPAPQQQP
jgi:hypothetical protein